MNDQKVDDGFKAGKFRIRSIKELVLALGKDGFCVGGQPRIRLLENEIYIEFLANVGKHGDVKAFPVEFTIPVEESLMPKASEPETESLTEEEQTVLKAIDATMDQAVPIPEELLEKSKELTKDMVIDLDEPIEGEVSI